ncbi:MAG: O-antigen ligase family protein [Akkermansia sp.]|nr:O-antigen ligase family protein [Akkermansia sp.]
MPEGVVRKRFVESMAGEMAGVLLGVLWLVSMCTVDVHAYAALPYMMGLGVVVLLGVMGYGCGLKFVRLPFLAWCSLAVGGYFLVRSMHSYAVVEAWREQALILSCAVFYVAGIYVGQLQGDKGTLWWIGIGVLANVVAFVVMRSPGADATWLGRPAMSLTGPNSPGVTLFVYKNFAALFLSLAGCVLVWRALWMGQWSIARVVQVIWGVVAIGFSCFCASRVIYVVVAAAVLMGWVLWLILRLYSGHRVGGWTLLTGVAVITLLGIGLYDLFFGNLLSFLLTGVDTHLRYLIWSNLCEVIPNAPAWGYGTGASQWEIVPAFNEWHTPNYAHNEYLQAWVDYGGIGLLLLVLVLLVHLGCGLLSIVSESVDAARRGKLAMACLVLVVMAVAAGTDFVWHDFSLAGMTAFCCGVLMTPRPRPAFSLKNWGRKWAAGHGPGMVPVRAQGIVGKFLLILLSGGVLLGCWQLWERTHAAWWAQWQYDAMVSAGASADDKRAFLGRVMQHYPDPGVMDCYARLPYVTAPDWAGMEALLHLALKANPKQLFTIVMLADVMGRQGKCQEVEMLLRRSYVGDGMEGTMLTAWPSYYSVNLLQWAQQEMSKGNVARARSMFNYAFRVGQFRTLTVWRGGERTWTEGGSKQRQSFVELCRADAKLLNAMGCAEDHSWQAPMEPGGKPALYRRWGNSERKKD